MHVDFHIVSSCLPPHCQVSYSHFSFYISVYRYPLFVRRAAYNPVKQIWWKKGNPCYRKFIPYVFVLISHTHPKQREIHFGEFYFHVTVTADKNVEFLQSSYFTGHNHRIECVSCAARSFN